MEMARTNNNDARKIVVEFTIPPKLQLAISPKVLIGEGSSKIFVAAATS